MKERYKDKRLKVQTRVKDLLSQMTLEEKVAQMDMIRGVELATRVHPAHFCAVDEGSDFHWDRVTEAFKDRGMGFVHDVYSTPAVLNRLQRYFVEETRLGIPCIFTGEALHGLSYPGATIFPMPLNLGAAFDRKLTQDVGHAIAAETRSLGIHEILAPNLDIARDPRWGRVEETFGEDTYLSAEMAYAIVSGEQGEDVSMPDAVVAEPKHFCVHGIPEGGLNCASARAGQREVEGIHLPVFEAGIQKAGAYNAMACYNNIDGEAVMASDHYLTEVLKNRYGLKGYIRADFGGINRLKTLHQMTTTDEESIEMAVNAGLDVQGFDYPNDVWQGALIKLVEEGKIPIERIDDAVSRILRVKFELGLFENPYTDEIRHRAVVRSQEHRQLSLRAAEESAVLLQNKNSVLPISPRVQSIALVGPSSNRQRVGSYASVPYGYSVPSLYEELRAMVTSDVKVWQEDGCTISDRDVTCIPSSWYTDGVKLSYYIDGDFSKEPIATDHADRIRFNWILAKPHRALAFNGYGVRMEGSLRVRIADIGKKENFRGNLVFTTDDSVRVWLNDDLVIDSVGESKQRLPSHTMRFVDGKRYDFVIEYVCDVNGNNVSLSVRADGDDGISRAVRLAQDADMTILVCGDDTVTSGEGMDRSTMTLYGKQDELVRRVLEVGKPTVLVLEVGKPVDLSAYVDQVDAILVPWFGGELGARAISKLLVGRVSPSGKLPISFPRSVGHLPCYYSLLPGTSAGEYLEGPATALFPFGHGITYTRFEYDNLLVERTEEPYGVRVSLHVANKGRRAADEVVQLYVRDVKSSVVTPRKLLKGFERVHLKAGSWEHVEFTLGFDAFKLLNARMEWVVEPGEFELMIGSSSDDIRLTETITL